MYSKIKKSDLELRKKNLKAFLDKLTEIDLNRLSNIRSLRKIALDIEIDNQTLRRFVLDYLEQKYGLEKSKIIRSKIWPPPLK